MSDLRKTVQNSTLLTDEPVAILDGSYIGTEAFITAIYLHFVDCEEPAFLWLHA